MKEENVVVLVLECQVQASKEVEDAIVDRSHS